MPRMPKPLPAGLSEIRNAPFPLNPASRAHLRDRHSGEREPKPNKNQVRARASDLEQLTVSEVAEICRYHPKTVRSWIKSGDLEAIRKGRNYRITWRALRKFWRKHQC